MVKRGSLQFQMLTIRRGNLSCVACFVFVACVGHYFANTQGLIYVVDSNDRDRIVEAREELAKMVGEEELRNATVLVFANKQDLPNAMAVADLTQELGLPNMTNRKWFVQACCAVNGTGLYEGLDWYVFPCILWQMLVANTLFLRLTYN